MILVDQGFLCVLLRGRKQRGATVIFRNHCLHHSA
tara:strand:- start:158 stop:262 length:105 start_codon:yes stop_codon:yes gene_type:complete